jgi:hypothetical protein
MKRLLVSLVLLIALCVSESRAASLKGCWNLDEGSGCVANDSSGNGFNGSIYGGATWSSEPSGNVLHFNGTDTYVDIPGTNSWNFPSGFTLSAMLRFSDYNGDVCVAGKLIYGYAAGYGLGVRDNKLWFYANNNQPLDRLQTVGTYNDSNWHKAVGIYDGTTQYFYVDGQLVDKLVIPYTNFNTTNLRIGTVTAGGYVPYYDGDIAQVKIYDYPNFYEVPEPSTFVLLAIGAISLIGFGWRRRK